MITNDETRQINHDTLREFIDRKWNDEIVPALTDYIAVPAKSPSFDPDWARHGFIERVVTDAAQWAERQAVRGLKLEVIRLPGRTPVIFFETPATRSTSSLNFRAGARISDRGHLNSKTANFTVAAVPTMATRSTLA